MHPKRLLTDRNNLIIDDILRNVINAIHINKGQGWISLAVEEWFPFTWNTINDAITENIHGKSQRFKSSINLLYILSTHLLLYEDITVIALNQATIKSHAVMLVVQQAQIFQKYGRLQEEDDQS